MDAEFFFAKDTKTTLESKSEKLKKVMFQEVLGSVFEKSVRIEQIAVYAVNLMENKSELFADIKDIEKAAMLSKADLVTDMVYEYPELQGAVGRIYAEAEGLPKHISDSIEEHYMPVTSDGKLPQGKLGMVLSVADKMDTLAGDFAAGLIPSGSADPYGLRRMAAGILRIIIEKKLSIPLKALVDKAFSLLPEKVRANTNTPGLVMDFLKNRLENLWEAEGYKFDETRAVLATGFDDLLDAVERLKALKAIRPQPGFDSLAAAFKRASNILKQAAKNKITVPDGVNESIFVEDAEKALYSEVRSIETGVLELTAKKDYLNALAKIVVLKPSVDAFFDKVMVMAEDESLRSNRLALLAYTAKLFSNILDFSQLQN
jgi:glycyl-tRNA synthetase beta chain